MHSRWASQTHELPAVRLPGGYLFSAHREMNRINLHTIPRRIPLLVLLYEALIVIPIGRFVKTSRETKVGQFEVTVLVDQDVVGFNVTDWASSDIASRFEGGTYR